MRYCLSAFISALEYVYGFNAIQMKYIVIINYYYYYYYYYCCYCYYYHYYYYY